MQTISAPLPTSLAPGDPGHVAAHQDIRTWMAEVGGKIPSSASEVGAGTAQDVASALTAATGASTGLAAALSPGGAVYNAVATATTASAAAASATAAAGTASAAAANAAALVAGKLATAAALLQAAAVPDAMAVGTIGRDSNAAVTTFAVVWPDGATGTFTTTVASTAFPGAVNAYTVTHILAGVTTTYTQSTLTRDTTSGAVITRPAITVA